MIFNLCMTKNSGNPLVYEDCNLINKGVKNYEKTGNPLVYEDCNLTLFALSSLDLTGNPLVYEDCNTATKHYCSQSHAGNPLVYEDCNCKNIRKCECYGTKDLLSYGGKRKKRLHGAKALDLIPITFYYRTNSP